MAAVVAKKAARASIVGLLAQNISKKICRSRWKYIIIPARLKLKKKKKDYYNREYNARTTASETMALPISESCKPSFQYYHHLLRKITYMFSLRTERFLSGILDDCSIGVVQRWYGNVVFWVLEYCSIC